MNRFEAELKRRGGYVLASCWRGDIGGRSWHVYRRPGGVEISQMNGSGFFPDHWHGKSENARAFKLLDSAAMWRRHGARAAVTDWRRKVFYGKALDCVRLSRVLRIEAERERILSSKA